MKKFYLLLLVLNVGFSFLYAQTIDLSFTGRYDTLHIPIDSIVVENITQGGDTTLYYPDTVLVLDLTTGLDNTSNSKSFSVSQNYPNPFMLSTNFELIIPEEDKVSIEIYDIQSKEVTSFLGYHGRGRHRFIFTSGNSAIYILSVSFQNETQSLKMFCLGENENLECDISFIGSESIADCKQSLQSKNNFNFTIGDQLMTIGYYQLMTDTSILSPTQDTLFKFDFKHFSKCPPSFTDPRDSNVYPAIQIGTQCWMTKNLAYLPYVDPPNSGSNYIPYYFVYNYSGTNVAAAKTYSTYLTYGALYNWSAAMHGSPSSDSVPSGVQGICPLGWHLPSDEEWKILEGEVDSLYGYPDPVWDNTGWRGSDVGGGLKEVGTVHWTWPNLGATNSSGFTALPGGNRYIMDNFDYLGDLGYFWTCTETTSSSAWRRGLSRDFIQIDRFSYDKENGRSVRCLMD